MDVNEIVRQIQSAATLYAEILIIIAASSLLGLFVGLMMQRSRHKRQITRLNHYNDDQYAALKDLARRESEQLEEQLQTVAIESKSLSAKNRVLSDTVKRNDAVMQKSRAEAIELNRRHIETQERLQRIIQQKDSELAELANQRSSSGRSTQLLDSSYASRLSSLNDELDSALYTEDTVAIFPSIMHVQEPLEDTVVATVLADNDVGLESTLDETADLSNAGIEESTVALTDETLAFAHRAFKGRSKDS